MYKIKINYRTGDSFNSFDTEDTIELTWKNLEIAKQNLQYIREHYEMYKECDSYKTVNQEVFKKYLDKEWFVNNPRLFSISNKCAIEESKKIEGDYEYNPDEYFARYCLKLKTDDEQFYQLHCFWCGYFETLYSASIEIDDSDMKFEL